MHYLLVVLIDSHSSIQIKLCMLAVSPRKTFFSYVCWERRPPRSTTRTCHWPLAAHAPCGFYSVNQCIIQTRATKKDCKKQGRWLYTNPWLIHSLTSLTYLLTVLLDCLIINGCICYRLACHITYLWYDKEYVLWSKCACFRKMRWETIWHEMRRMWTKYTWVILPVIIIITKTIIAELGHRLKIISHDTRERSFLFQRFKLTVQRFNAVAFRGCFADERDT